MISVGGKLRWPLMGVHQSLAGQVGHCFGVVVVVVVVVVVFIFLFWNPPETSIGMVYIYIYPHTYEMAYDFLYDLFFKSWVFFPNTTKKKT